MSRTEENDNKASGKALDTAAGSVFPEPNDKDYKRTMLLGILAEFSENPTPANYTDTANRIEELYSQNDKDDLPPVGG